MNNGHNVSCGWATQSKFAVGLEEKGKDTNEVNENAITQQKQKAEQMINELQLKMKQIVLDSDPRNDEELPAEDLDQAENSQKSDAIIGALRQIQHDITGQYDFSLGNIDHGLANLFCQENLHIVTMPKNYLPKRAKTGDIITISVARKKADHELMKNLIINIQDEILKFQESQPKLF